jgi:hypothetical protein
VQSAIYLLCSQETQQKKCKLISEQLHQWRKGETGDDACRRVSNYVEDTYQHPTPAFFATGWNKLNIPFSSVSAEICEAIKDLFGIQLQRRFFQSPVNGYLMQFIAPRGSVMYLHCSKKTQQNANESRNNCISGAERNRE